ncbi:hypothetical protein F5Y06DRAFT_153382 [Hypoxylon sp. FL0890]|nr:hypothetical protein F5Y06DRAFT_153382 [Hypoxylon sp. FL0890]
MLDHLQGSSLCLFLDGLDECRMVGRTNEYTEEQLDLIYDGDNEDEAWGQSDWITDGHKEIADFVHSLRIRGNVKVCLSSRDLNVFEREFRNFPRIVVHEHTAKSIARYCTGHLMDRTPDLMDLPEFASAITEKSCGVFLWVRLVIGMLVDGYTNGDSREELLETLDHLPQRLGGKDGLYSLMMRNIKRKYLPESKRLFQLVLNWKSVGVTQPDIITLFLAVQGHLEQDNGEELRATSDKYEPRTWDELQPKCKELQRRLKSRCGGLLEGTWPVQFMHQTVKQFLSRKYIWDEMFSNVVGFAAESDVHMASISGCVRRLKCCADAVTTLENVSIDLGANAHQQRSTEHEHKVDLPYLDSEILHHALACARTMCCTTDIIAGRLRRSLIELLDELNNVWSQHTSGSDSVWFDMLHEYLLNTRKSRPLAFLQLAITYSLVPYVETKVKHRGLSKHQLSHLLLRAVKYPMSQWRTTISTAFHENAPKFVEMLFQEGADPNHLDTTTSEARWTIWVSHLEELASYPLKCSVIEFWVTSTKLFLKYGADTTVRWYRPNSSENKESPIEWFTPEKIIRDRLNSEYDKDLDEIMELLSQANEKQHKE